MRDAATRASNRSQVICDTHHKYAKNGAQTPDDLEMRLNLKRMHLWHPALHFVSVVSVSDRTSWNVTFIPFSLSDVMYFTNGVTLHIIPHFPPTPLFKRAERLSAP